MSPWPRCLRGHCAACLVWIVACATQPSAAESKLDAASGRDANGGMHGEQAAAAGASALGVAGRAGGAATQRASAEVPPLAGFGGAALLSQTGLYADIALQILAEGVLPYSPLGELWADGATKQRWIWLPPSAQIDTTDMDQWRFPVGAKLWKEFALAGLRLETRLIEKLESGEWRMVAYAWNAEQTEAHAAPLGIRDAAGSSHDVPDTEACKQCHEGLQDRVLGFTALQLSHPGARMTLDRLVADGRLSVRPATSLVLPGDSIDQAALGYLHANCGHCHRPDRKRADREISVYFWQESESLASVRDTVTYKSLVSNRTSPLWIDALLARMQTRGNTQQMPPLASKMVDMQAVALLTPWLMRLRAELPAQVAAPPVQATTKCEGVEQVFAIFERAACRTAFCHGAGTGKLDFTTPQQLHDSLVGVPASGEGCKDLTTMPRVQPGAPERSLLMIKLLPGPPCGKIMPPAEVQALSMQDLEQVRSWIAGCKN